MSLYQRDEDGDLVFSSIAEDDIDAMREQIAEDEDRDPDDISDDECIEALEDAADEQYQGGGGRSRWINY